MLLTCLSSDWIEGTLFNTGGGNRGAAGEESAIQSPMPPPIIAITIAISAFRFMVSPPSPQVGKMNVQAHRKVPAPKESIYTSVYANQPVTFAIGGRRYTSYIRP